MKIHQLCKWLSLCLTIFVLITPVAKAEVGNLYSDPNLERLFAARPLDESKKAEVLKALNSLHTRYLNETDNTFKSELLRVIRSSEPQLTLSQEGETTNRWLSWTAQCWTKKAMEKLDRNGVFSSGLQSPQDVLDKSFFDSATEVCYIRGTTAYTIEWANRSEAKRRLESMKSVNDVLLNGSKYTKAIYISGFFIYDQRGPSLLMHSQNNINRVFVNTSNLEVRYLRKVMECSLGCNLQFLGSVGTYYRDYIIDAFQVYDAPN